MIESIFEKLLYKLHCKPECKRRAEHGGNGDNHGDKGRTANPRVLAHRGDDVRPGQHEHGDNHRRLSGPQRNGMQIAVDPGTAGHAFALAAAAMNEVTADIVAVLRLAFGVDVIAMPAVLGITAELRINDGIAEKVKQAAQDEPEEDGVTCSPLQNPGLDSFRISRRGDHAFGWTGSSSIQL